jgi:hypothetical protein
MPNPLDLTDQRFGCLTVVRLAERGDDGLRRWLCRCDCGNERTVPVGYLRSGDTRFCGPSCPLRPPPPNALNLTGKRFGRLTVVRLAEKHDNGRRWLCRCDCGNETTVPVGHLRSGNTGSCGDACRLRKALIGRKTRQAYKQRERVRDDDGSEWFAPRLAARYLGVSLGTLDNWRERCPYKDGAGLETRPLPGRYSQDITFYGKADLDRVKTAMAALQPTPTYPGVVPLTDAARTLRVHFTTVYRLLAKHGYAAEVNPAKSVDGYSRPRAFVPTTFVEAVQAERAAACPPDRLSIMAAAKCLGVSYDCVQLLIRKGDLTALPGGPRKNSVQISRAAVEMLKAKRETEDNARLAAPGWEDSRTLARLHQISHDYMIDLLRDWVKAGLLTYRPGWRWRTKPRKRTRVRIYDADKVAQLMAKVRTENPVPANGPTATASPASDNPMTPMPQAAARAHGRKGGRPRSRDTEALYELCYTLREQGSKYAAIRAAAQEAYGVECSDGDILNYARRYAERHGKPFSPRS